MEQSWRVLGPNDTGAEERRRQFASDVLHGLFRVPKNIPSRYFYDEEGNRLFQTIMELPEYYLTDCELEILEANKESIAARIGRDHLGLGRGRAEPDGGDLYLAPLDTEGVFDGDPVPRLGYWIESRNSLAGETNARRPVYL